MKKMGEKLEPGLYEQVISEKLATLLSTLPEGRSDERRIDPAEGAEVLTGYLSGIVRQGLSEIGEAPRPSKNSKEATIPDSLAAQISLANEIISLIRKRTRSAQGTSVGADTSDEDLIDAEGKQLLGITLFNCLIVLLDYLFRSAGAQGTDQHQRQHNDDQHTDHGNAQPFSGGLL